MAFLFANNVNTTLAAAATSTQATLSLTSTVGIPTTIPSGDYFAMTLNDAATRSVFEVVYVTAVSGSNVTVLRGQEGTGANAWSVGDYIYASNTAGILSSFANQSGNSGIAFNVLTATTSTQAVTLGQLQNNTLALSPTTVNASGQVSGANATSAQNYVTLGQLQNQTLALSPTTVDASGTVSATEFYIAAGFALYNNSGNYTVGLGASQYISGPSGGSGALTYNATGHFFNTNITVNGGAGSVGAYGIFCSANNSGIVFNSNTTVSVNSANSAYVPHNAANGTSGNEVVNYGQFDEPISATALASGNDNTVSATASFSAPGPGLLIASGSRNNSSSTGVSNTVTLYINGTNVSTENSSSSATIFGTATTSGGTVSAEITAALSIPFSARVSLTWIPFGLIT